MSEKANKKRNYAIAKIVVVLCVVLCIVLTVFEMGFTYRVMKAAEVEGTEYSVAEYNWLYTNSLYEVYNDYYNTYGDLASYIINPNAPLDEQYLSGDEGETWADYIKKYTDSSLVTMTALYNEAAANGYELPQEYYDSIDAEWAAAEASAKEAGYSVGNYVELSYGRGVNEEVFRKMFETYYYAFTYAMECVDGIEVTAEDIDAYYSENAAAFDSVSYKYYYINGAAEEGETAETAMEAARTEAEEVLNGSKEVEFTESKYAVKANISTLYADWLFDSARVAGDKEIFEGESAVYVVEFVGMNDLHYNTVDVRHILVSPESSSDEAAWQDALIEAQSYAIEWESMGKTEEAFIELADKYTEESSAPVGGLYENVFKGQMVTEFNDWCFDPARTAGDSEIIKTSYGYHLMYFVGEAEEYYTYAVGEAIRNAEYSELLAGLTEGVEVTELSGYKHGGAHFN